MNKITAFVRYLWLTLLKTCVPHSRFALALIIYQVGIMSNTINMQPTFSTRKPNYIVYINYRLTRHIFIHLINWYTWYTLTNHYHYYDCLRQ